MDKPAIVRVVTLKEARELAGLSRDALAKAADTTTTTIYDLEVGRNQNPSHETVVRIVRALQTAGLKGITTEALFPVEAAS